jgi:hypothetical protein
MPRLASGKKDKTAREVGGPASMSKQPLPFVLGYRPAQTVRNAATDLHPLAAM